ncbi:hypothetical protein [Vacuolonema iberomarrocanum]|uniref:hypothetical protein n=1 Tax=Vacuolonema iberomarrocanum TaxID=3454632 RepID=UPI0019EC4C78|nr:hypothetical protein [filamentous cyanobacterium LEGE 07170]
MISVQRLWIGGLIGLGLLGWMAEGAIARPRGMEGSYLGATIDGRNVEDGVLTLLGVGSSQEWVYEQATPDEEADDAASSGQRHFQTRIDVQELPISLRGAVVLGDEIEAVMPGVTYDLPVGNDANVYAGAGYVIVRPGAQTVLGDRDGVVFTTGVEASINQRVILYGNVRLHPTNVGEQDPIRFQFGLGHRF